MSKLQQERIKILRAENAELKKQLRKTAVKPKKFNQTRLYEGVERGEKTFEEIVDIVNSAIKRGIITSEHWWDAFTYIDFKYNGSKFTTPGSNEFKESV